MNTILLLAALAIRLHALPGDGVEMRRSVIGVNHLAYGKDGYGLLLEGRHKIDPDLIKMQRDLGMKSLRYPGGCGGTHGFRWKWNAGLEGNYWALGVVEFLGMCEEVGADPILGLSALRGTPQEAAEYVEFLNAPADEAHPWAKRRAARGHAAPYGVTYFEYGNETYHGSHPHDGAEKQRVTAGDYAANYLAFRAAMRAVDPRVKLGVVLSGRGTGWNRRVLEGVGDKADFYILHTYGKASVTTNETDYLALFVGRRRGVEKMISGELAEIGRPDAELAVTEFNTTFKEHKTLTAGLVNLETLFALAAATNVAHADYWQFVNEGFGMVRGKRGAFVKRPNALAFELYARHTLDTLLPFAIDDPALASSPRCDKGSALVAALSGKNFAENITFTYQGKKRTHDKGTATRYVRREDGTHELTFLDDRAMNFYHLQAHVGGLPKGNGCNWKVSCKMRVEGMKGEDVNLDVTDGRGWVATHSASALPAVGSPDWIEVSTVYSPLVDNPGSLVVRFRRDGGAGAGTVYMRDLRIEAIGKEVPSTSPVCGQLSRSCDGRRTALVLLNRCFTPREVEFDLPGASRALAEALVGSSAYATNEERPDDVKIAPLAVRLEAGAIRLTLPPHSATGVLAYE